MGDVLKFKPAEGPTPDSNADDDAARAAFFDITRWGRSKRGNPYYVGDEHVVTLTFHAYKGWSWYVQRRDNTGDGLSSHPTFACDGAAVADAWLWRDRWPV